MRGLISTRQEEYLSTFQLINFSTYLNALNPVISIPVINK